MNDIQVHLENCDPSFSGMESGRVMRAAGLSNAIGRIPHFPEEQAGQFQENKYVLYIPITSQVPNKYRAKDGVPPTTPPAVTCCSCYGRNPI